MVVSSWAGLRYSWYTVPVEYTDTPASVQRRAVHLSDEDFPDGKRARRMKIVARSILRFTPPRRDLTCATLAEEEVNLSDRAFVEVAARGAGDLFLDAVALEPAQPAEYAR